MLKKKKTYDGMTTLRMSEEMQTQLAYLMENTGKSKSEVFRKALKTLYQIEQATREIDDYM